MEKQNQLFHNLHGLHHAAVLVIENVTMEHELSVEVFVAHPNLSWSARCQPQRISPDYLWISKWVIAGDLKRIHMDMKRVESLE